ncbi:hypothetical protein I545_0142 [Mycobacterium kansasii 662]|uniref:Uncharacterized protein n=3 Tax=Mycobacterium kansasii TaxID=1768 RepID=A0A1V3XZ74_MYCKA|nr:hypothetical protein MKAN_20300 [Mycobacterium kansasii ATCC 12478]EUA03251.1 hypothetical protein I547_1301 [Mycobacterium kansasii 824]EUA21130.1 hypothetical protein I545_0142 [Mycobacterium kansasii 662]KEP43727.1 hypothetical protein MKSMC1_10910 [Mycobacterium kansasii]OOK84553.1 hypothetical protein BZL29_0158 [Mycobacterium kansasii]
MLIATTLLPAATISVQQTLLRFRSKYLQFAVATMMFAAGSTQTRTAIERGRDRC